MLLLFWTDFFEELQTVRGRSQNTVMAYRRDLELYAEFVSENLQTAQIYEFFRKKDLSPRSQARMVSSIRTYLKFCESRGEKCPQLRELRQPKSKKALPKVLTTEQFYALQEAAVTDNERQTLRNQLTLSLLFGSGCRVSELIDLDLADYNSIERWLKVTGKGGKQRLVPLTEVLVQAVNQYLELVRPTLAKEKTESILVNDRGRRPSRIDIWRWLMAWSAKAGFEEPVSPHQLRHGCATALLDSGADLRSIQLLLGHSSIQTTQIYTSVSTQHLRDAVDKFHPLSDKISNKDSEPRP
jgi:integrase/recombinase XerD